MIQIHPKNKLDLIYGLFLRHVLGLEVVIFHTDMDRKFMRSNLICLLLKKI